jgi:hypothetical protein
MNKAKTWSNQPTKEVDFYMREVGTVCKNEAKKQNIRAKFLRGWIRERVGIKRAITGAGVPNELVNDFKGLWQECTEFLNE